MARCHVHLSDGRDIVVAGDRPLLQELHSAGCKVPAACRNGHCGRCNALLLSGRVSPPVCSQSFALCTHFPETDLELQLALSPAWRHFHCQLISFDGQTLRLRLPAGRRDVSGTRWLVATNRVSPARLARCEGRELQLISERALEPQELVTVINIDAEPAGEYTLSDESGVLVDGLTRAVAREVQDSLIQFKLKRR